MSVPGRISLVTLGVADLATARKFYDALGFERVGDDEGVAFYRTGGALLSLYPLAALAEDAQISASRTGFGGTTLAINLEGPDAVDAALEHAAAVGATILRPGGPVFWGGYLGYFADPDGHVWEIAHNPHWPLDDRGLPVLG